MIKVEAEGGDIDEDDNDDDDYPQQTKENG